MNDMCSDSIPPKSRCEDTPYLRPIMDQHIKQVQKAYENALNQVLRKVLGREPVAEDWKDCARVYKSDGESDPMNFWFAWKGITLGKVTFEMGPTYTITFTPDEKYR